MNYFIPRTR